MCSNRSFLQIWSYLLKKSTTENFTFCAVFMVIRYEILVITQYVNH